MTKILAIDDNKTNLILLERILKENFKGAEVVLGNDGLEGLNLARSETPDTILLDIQMPELDGFEVCKKLKDDPKTSHIPIIFITAVYDDPESRIRGLELGADGFISKPFIIGELIAQVKVMLRIKKAEDRLRAENIQLESLVVERTEKHKTSEEKFRQLSENIDDAVILIQDKDILYLNPAFTEISGLDDQVVYANPFVIFKLIPKEYKQDIADYFKSSLRTNNSFSKEIQIMHPTKSRCWVWVRIFSIPDDKGKVYRKVAIVSDITERKEIEAQIMKTIIKTEEKERKRFSEDLHDGLGPLLSSVKLYINLLQTKNKSEIKKEENAKLLKFVEELIDEAILNTKSIANDLTPNLLNDYGLNQAVKNFCNKINKSELVRINFHSNLDENRFEPEFEINLYRITKELINNTLKHAEAQNIIIEIMNAGKDLILNYKDDGKGCELNSVLKDNGSGLGLRNITNRIKSLNGEIDFNSEPSKGMQVSIKITV
jgi:PAS domain S-box-containing protein